HELVVPDATGKGPGQQKLRNTALAEAAGKRYEMTAAGVLCVSAAGDDPLAASAVELHARRLEMSRRNPDQTTNQEPSARAARGQHVEQPLGRERQHLHLA